ncbi:MAG: ATP-binding cassette domain-containing protein [Bacilli bacterium]|nr:ATP-binding cassette domain-containing protein [Bacilli bacterium]
MKAVEISNLNFSYDDNVIFENFSFNVEKGSFMTVLGRGGIGKSTLFKILKDEINYGGKVLFFNKSIKYSLEKGYVGYISLDCDYINGKVIDVLVDVLKLKGRTFDKIKVELRRIVKKLEIEDLLYYDYSDLSISEKIVVMFAYQFLFKPRLLIIDNVIDYLDDEKDKTLRELIRFNKRGTIINITNNTEESLVGNHIFIIGSGSYDVNSVDEDLFISNGLGVPFMISLCNKLKYYNLINTNYYNMEKLVDALWE